MIYRIKTLVLGFVKQYAGVAFLSLFLAVALANSPVSLADTCSGLNGEFGDLLGCSEEFTSFKNFQGGLEAPSTAGYDSSLTQATDTREYVKNIANFALGFLGLIAVLIIIYSGFLYVTSAADSDGVESAKSNIKNSVIGIFIILGSFAFVNTILTAPGGGGAGGAGGNLAQSQNTNAAQLANYNSAAAQIQEMSKQLVAAYTVALDDTRFITKFSSQTPNDFTSRSDFVDYLNTVRSSLMGLYSKRGPLSLTGLSARTIADQVIDPAILTINGVVQEERVNKLQTTVGEAGLLNFLDDIADGFGDIFGGAVNNEFALQNYICSLPESERPVNYVVEGCEDAGTILGESKIGTIISNNLNEKLDNKLRVAIANDFIKVIEDLTLELETIAISTQGYKTLSDQIKKLYQALTSDALRFCEIDEQDSPNCKGLSERTTRYFEDDDEIDDGTDQLLITIYTASGDSEPAATAVSNYLSKFNEIYRELSNVKFTIPVITASVTSGTAPLIVTFDGSASIDPANRSLDANNLEWDLDGDGFSNTNQDNTDITCNVKDSNNATKFIFNTCTFKEPGSYRVGLRLNYASDVTDYGSELSAERFLPGIAYTTIRVLPQQTKIQLSAKFEDTADAVEIHLRKFAGSNENRLGDLEIDVEELFVTTSEARSGIILDASKSFSDSSIVKYTWRFSDEIGARSGTGNRNTDDSNNTSGQQVESGDVITKTFDRQGVTNGILEVQDGQGNIDRKIFKVIVANHVPRIQTSAVNGLVMDEFVLDASQSSSSMGLFSSFAWEIDGVTPAIADGGSSNNDFDFDLGTDDETIKLQFKSPGTKEVKLKATPQGSEEPVETTISVNVSPREPVAQVRAVFPSPENDPGRVDFSSEGSLSGDEALFGDNVELSSESVLSFSWKVVNAVEGKQFEAVEADETFEGENLNLRFLEPGRYTVLLEAKEPFVVDGQELFVAKVAQKVVTIDNVINVRFAEDFNPVAPLTVGEESSSASVDVELESFNADKAQIFFGDGRSEVLDFLAAEGAAEGDPMVATTTHVYETAGNFTMKVRAFKGSSFKEITQQVTISPANEPLAVITLTDRFGNSFINPTEGLFKELIRGERVKVSGDRSLNANGTTGGLRFSYDTGDGRNFTRSNFDLSYQDLPTGTDSFDLKLTVTDESDLNKSDFHSAKLVVESFEPTIDSINLSRLTGTTPFTVVANAVGAEDLDGRIEEFQFTLQDTGSQTPEYVISSRQPRVSMIIPTKGDTGEAVNWKVSVKAIDNEFNESDNLESDKEIEAVNGPNEMPIAKFNVDRTSVTVGEEVTFFSSALDADGEIASVQYDLNGNGSFIDDGFGNAGPNSTDPANPFVFSFDKKSPASGYRISQMVVDDNGSRAVSRPLTIFVDSVLEAPKAAFETDVDGLQVTITDQSTLDFAGGADKQTASYKWDSNVNVDSDGDGVSDNDVDSTDINPAFEYETTGKFRIKLTLEDHEGNVDTVINSVSLEGVLDEPTAAFLFDADGLVVRTNNKSRVDANNGGVVRNYIWDFDITKDSDGDGIKDNDVDSDVENPVITYETKGTKKVKLTIVDSEGQRDSVIQTIRIEGKLNQPTAAFLFEVDGLSVNFDNNSNIDTANGGTIQSIAYDVDTSVDSNGDGIRDNDPDSILPEFTHTYENKGIFKVKMSIVDSEGNTDSIERSITVGADILPPVAAFGLSLDEKTVSFDNTSRPGTPGGAAIVDYAWDFDLSDDSDNDGVSDNDVDSTDQNPNDFTYETIGKKTVRLTVKDDLGNTDSIDKSVVIQEKETLAPTAAFVPSINELKVDFTNNSKSDTENSVTLDQFIWDFDLSSDADGDGESDNDLDSNKRAPSFTYDKAGTYEVKLTVIDSEGKTDSITRKILVEEKVTLPPTAAFKATGNKLEVEFQNNSRSDSANNVTLSSFVWDFDLNEDFDGDGVANNDKQSTLKNPKFTYEQPGTYKVGLIVTDSKGKIDTVTQDVTVTKLETLAPTAAFSFSNSGLVVTFKDNSRFDKENNAEIVEVSYDFNTLVDSDGDGVKNNDSESNDKNPTFEYETPGVYQVRLIVTDSFGKSDFVDNTVRVEGDLIEQGASAEEAARVAEIKSAAQAAAERVAALEAQLAAIEDERSIIDDPASAALPEGISAADREAQRQSQIAQIQADLLAQQEQLRQRQLERDAEIRRIQENFAQQQLDREAAGLQSGLSATTRRVVPRDFEVGSSNTSGTTENNGTILDDILDRAIGGAEQGIEELTGVNITFDPQNFIVASPSVNQDDEIGIIGNTGVVRLNFNHLPEFIESVLIDKNIFRDTNSGAPGTTPDGSRNNDVDFLVTDFSQNLNIEYSVNDSPARLMMTLIDSNGNVYIDQVKIVFGNAARN